MGASPEAGPGVGYVLKRFRPTMPGFDALKEESRLEGYWMLVRLADGWASGSNRFLKRGEALYGAHCLSCHGLEAIAAGWAPDLRGSMLPQSAEAFASVVRDGGLAPTGMPKFDDLSDADLAAIRQYLRSRTADLRAGKH